MNKRLKNIWASALSAAISGLYVAGVTIYADLNIPFKDWLKTFTGHHWVTKSVSSLVLFIVLFAILSAVSREKSEASARRALWTLFATTLLSALAIFVFYLWHYFFT